MKKSLLSILLLFAFVAVRAQDVPQTKPVVRSVIYVPQASPPSNPTIGEKYLNVDGSYYRWNGSSWIVDVVGGSSTTDASQLTTGVLADGRVQQSNVTQHQAALSITESQITDLAHTPPADGSETVVTAGANVTVTGTGTAGNPYQINSTGGSGSTNLTYDAATRTIASDTGTDAVLPVADNTNPGLLPVADKVKLDNLTVSNPYDLDSWSFEIAGISLRELISNKATNLTAPDNTKYPTTLAVSNALNQKIESNSTPPTGWEQVTEIYSNDYSVTPSPGTLPAGALGFRENMPPAVTFTGTVIPLDDYYQRDDTTDDTPTWTIDASPENGASVEILINIASEPAPFSTDTGVTQISGTTDFAANTLQLLTVKVILGTVYYYYTTL